MISPSSGGTEKPTRQSGGQWWATTRSVVGRLATRRGKQSGPSYARFLFFLFFSRRPRRDEPPRRLAALHHGDLPSTNGRLFGECSRIRSRRYAPSSPAGGGPRVFMERRQNMKRAGRALVPPRGHRRRRVPPETCTRPFCIRPRPGRRAGMGPHRGRTKHPGAVPPAIRWIETGWVRGISASGVVSGARGQARAFSLISRWAYIRLHGREGLNQANAHFAIPNAKLHRQGRDAS